MHQLKVYVADFQSLVLFVLGTYSTYTKHCFGHLQHMLAVQFAHTKHSVCMMFIKRVIKRVITLCEHYLVLPTSALVGKTAV